MKCNCSLVQTVLYLVIAVLAFWPALLGSSSLIIGIAAVLLLVHQFACKECCDVSQKKKR
ncbi:hypothetical protein FJZ22_01615 [Candidatus Pacearchaeota archaeon]|nr:hypothetical protein [Candidatus Pacearchaeota archaeon]